MKIKGAIRLLMVAALVVMAATMLAGCEGLWDEEEIEETYEHLESQRTREDDFGGDGGSGDCVRDCTLAQIWDGPSGESIQITAQCSNACCAQISGNSQQRQASCATLDVWTRHLRDSANPYNARSACRSC